MTDYSKSKYEDAIAEAADAIILEGLADETFGSVHEGGYYALVTMYPPTSGHVPPDDAFAEASRQHPLLIGSRVIIRTDEQGFVWRHYGPAHPTADPDAYRALMGEWSTLMERWTGETSDEAETLYEDFQR